MKVCFLMHQGSMYSGGQGIYLHHITRELAAFGHDVHVIGGPPYPDLDPKVTLHKVHTYSIYRLLETGRPFFFGRRALTFFHPLNFYEIATSRSGMFSVMAAFSIRAYEKLVELAEEGHYFDVIHDVQGLGYGALLLKANGLPIVANIHHPLQVDRANSVRQAKSIADKVRWIVFYPFFMQEIVARRIDRVITGSDASARSVAREFSLPPEHVAVIYDGVDTSTFRPLEAAREPGSILYVGNSDDRNKGARYLIEAMALLKERPDLRLTVVDRPNASTVTALAEELGVADRVTLTGRLPIEELVLRYNTCEIFVSPSLYEGFGLPAAEAMSCGAAVIATTAGAFPEVIEDGVSGLLVPPGDAQALADAIRRLTEDAALRQRLGEAGRSRIAEHFSWRETARKTAALYEEVSAARAAVG